MKSCYAHRCDGTFAVVDETIIGKMKAFAASFMGYTGNWFTVEEIDSDNKRVEMYFDLEDGLRIIKEVVAFAEGSGHTLVLVRPDFVKFYEGFVHEIGTAEKWTKAA